MWQQISLDLPPELAAKTLTSWLYPGIMYIGVMRESMLAPPYLWAQVVKGGFRNVRKAPGLLDELQQLLVAPVVFAEAETAIDRNQDLLVYLGFSWVKDLGNRRLYQRSI